MSCKEPGIVKQGHFRIAESLNFKNAHHGPCVRIILLMKKILLTGYLVCQLLHGIGQSDSLLYTQSLNQAVETFQSARQEQLPIYTGISYLNQDR